MKKSPSPHWNLIVADAMMFIAVIAIAYPNIVLMETMSGTSVLLCSILILSAMAMMLTPYVFDYLNQKQSISNDAKKTKENIDLIFENLSALQLMIAETKELGDEIEEKLAFQLAKDTDTKFDVFQEGIEKLRDNVKAKLKEVNNAIEQLHEKLADAVAQSESESMKLDELSEAVVALKDSLEAIESRSVLEQSNTDNTTIETIDEETFETNEITEDDKNDLEEIATEDNDDFEQEQISKPQEALDEESESDKLEPPQDLIYEIDPATTDYTHQSQQNVIYDGAEDIIDDDSHEQIEMQNPEQSHISDEVQNSKLSGLMGKALGNAMSSAPSVEKLISASTTNLQRSSNEISENSEEDIFNDNSDIEEIVESSVDEDSEISVDAILDDIDFDDEKKNEQEQKPLVLETENTASNTQETVQKEIVSKIADELLFDELPSNKKIKATKKDASITLHALIGIGNKPYLRGDNSLLRLDKGTPMDYAEIGVWKAVLPPFEGELNFSIWKNDEEKIGEQSYTIQSGKKQEITL